MQLEEAVKKIKSKLEEEANNIIKGLEPLLESKNKIPESLFVNYFLPRFLGIVNDEKYVLEWISIAGSPSAEVSVFKDGTNEILYDVPPIIYTNNVLLKKTGGDIGDIMTTYNNMSNNIPMQGLKFLISALDGKTEEIRNIIDINKPIERWKNIMRRYGYLTEEGSNFNNNNQNDLDDAFEY